MNIRNASARAAALTALILITPAAAQEATASPPAPQQPAAPEIEALDREVEALKELVRALEEKIASMTAAPPAQASTGDAEALKREVETLKELVRALEEKIASMTAAPSPPSPAEVSHSSPAPLAAPEPQPLTLFRTQSAYMNVSLDALFDIGTSSTPEVSGLLNLGDHDPSARGATLPNTEIVLEGAVDPYFKGLADIVWKLDEKGETGVELEESYIVTTALPGHLSFKAGQWFTDFGRHNPRHPHQWDFVDLPLVLSRLFGPDGLRNPGVQVSWLAPTPFFLETRLTILNGVGETAWSFRNLESTDFHGRAGVDRPVKSLGDLVYSPRIAASFELGPSNTLVLGATTALGPNSAGDDTGTSIYGFDVYWKWRPERAMKGFPFFSLQAEGTKRRYEVGEDPAAGLPAETLRDDGFYAQCLWGFRPRWVLGLRGEAVGGDRGAFPDEGVFRAGRTRLSTNLTWYPSEFSKLRFQYNRDSGRIVGDQNSLWVQMEFLLGSHGAHKF